MMRHVDDDRMMQLRSQGKEARRREREARRAERRAKRRKREERRASGLSVEESDDSGSISDTSSDESSEDGGETNKHQEMGDTGGLEGMTSVSSQTPMAWMMGLNDEDDDDYDDDDDDDESAQGSKSRRRGKKKKKKLRKVKVREEDIGLKMASSVIASIYESKLTVIQQDPDNLSFKSFNIMQGFILDSLRVRFGITELADKYWFGLVTCCRKRSSRDKRIALFADAMGISTTASSTAHPFDARRTAFFFTVMTGLYPKSGAGKFAAVYSSGWLDKEIVMNVFRETFFNLRVKQQDAYAMAETMLGDLPTTIKQGTDRKVPRVRADEVLELFMRFSSTEITLRLLSNIKLSVILALRIGIVRWTKRHRASRPNSTQNSEEAAKQASKQKGK